MAILPHWLILDTLLQAWLKEDIGRGDRTTQALGLGEQTGQAELEIKQAGMIAGLSIFGRVFQLLEPTAQIEFLIQDGEPANPTQIAARVTASLETLLLGERVALNLVMHLSGVASLTRIYADLIADLPTQLVDTRKTTPGLRLLEKYATQVGGAINHRFGLDDAVMIKDNHIQAAGGIAQALDQIRTQIPFTHKVEVETETLGQVQTALAAGADIIMLDNMPIERMTQAVDMIRHQRPEVKIEASGNITQETIRTVALTGVDYISTSATITRSPWLDCSLNLLAEMK
ncbi:carboxylating nicotinate-nucleotide diphosphorylase [Thermosynechococcaceae cyanobacterium BACA0444]|uniref:Probable nicotinate-nucleotide pyrophosphorylase [carboxylating] n=1 Tax=Pseudocalidococcus azoricus BACA0444 TaxID=2918990 RepID=A0AAE4FRJ6_9CYAN|nr:carboxylating nicotinate-nucleotide diphosphorylase [Pseudocalidococcus azoricus]MDS3860438.1 carboxylating nicotinate-nucleotide diphosphorylase [Pseudocalidococcus azoricus BACA0444]